MSETGGPVFEGSSAKVEATKTRVVDKVLDRVKNRLKQNTGEIVEKKWMDAYQKTVDALDPGMRKKAVEMVKPLAWTVAKVNRLGTAVTDYVLGLSGGFEFLGGVGEVIFPNRYIDSASQFKPTYKVGEKEYFYNKKTIDSMEKRSEMSTGRMRAEGVLDVGKGIGLNVLAKNRISRVASGWMADIVGVGGEKVAQITNKILRGKPKE